MIIQNVLVLLGPPGSGKGTQGKLLAPILKYNYLSMGQFLRDFTTKDTQLARQIKETIDSGRIIPDAWMRDLFGQAVENLPQADGIILDGFPRDVAQEPILEEFMEKHHTNSLKVVFLEVAEEKLLARINSREGTSGRADDEPQIIHTRFIEYEQKTFPLKKYFEDKGILVAVNGDQSIEGTHKEILRKLGL